MDGTEQATGTLIRVDHGSRQTWHHSVSFDGYEHETACGQSFECHEFNCLLMDISEWDDLYNQRCCDECAGSVRSLRTATELGGSMSESASDLYWSAVEKGREVARASRYGALNNQKLAELLPELPEDERRVLGERIEGAIENEVKNTLTQQEREVNDDD